MKVWVVIEQDAVAEVVRVVGVFKTKSLAEKTVEEGRLLPMSRFVEETTVVEENEDCEIDELKLIPEYVIKKHYELLFDYYNEINDR